MDLMSVSDEAAIREAGLKAEDVSDFDRNIRIRAIDVMRTPKFERVWQVGGIGEVGLVYILFSFWFLCFFYFSSVL